MKGFPFVVAVVAALSRFHSVDFHIYNPCDDKPSIDFRKYFESVRPRDMNLFRFLLHRENCMVF